MYKEIRKIIKNKIFYFKRYYFPKEPEVDSFWYFIVNYVFHSRSVFKIRFVIFLIIASFIIIIFIIYRFIWEHESLVLMVFILIFCSTLFYIFCW